MKRRKQEITNSQNSWGGGTWMTGWWRRTGIFCLILAATAIASLAQERQPAANSVNFTTLINFDSTDGGNPGGSLVQGTDGNLYGTTFDGGANINCFGTGCGTFFKVSPSGTLTSIYNFCAQPNCTDGSLPSGAVVLGIDGNFYGITESGGANGYGTAFKITPDGALTTLHDWCSPPDNADGCYGYFQEPNTLVQARDGNFYGTNDAGCPAACSGTFFRLTPSGTLTTLYTFCSQANCTDGGTPTGLIQGIDGNFYGTNYGGGLYGWGTVFKITPEGALTTLYNFCSQTNCTDGALPFGSLIEGTDGNFYGSTTYGGANVNSASCMAESGSCGTVFKIAQNGTLTTVYDFCSQTNCTDGAGPEFALVQATDGNFYGSTSGGGTSTCSNFGSPGCGTVYKLTPGGALTSLQGFDSQSQGPDALFQATNGMFYGTTLEGGTYDTCGGLTCGTLFSLGVGLGPFVETVPTSGKVAAAVTILGNKLTDATSVTFNGTPATFTVNPAGTAIKTTVPSGATSGKVDVATPHVTLKSNVPFRVRP